MAVAAVVVAAAIDQSQRGWESGTYRVVFMYGVYVLLRSSSGGGRWGV